MSLLDIEKEWYDNDGVRHWRLKSNPSIKYDDRYDRNIISSDINKTTKNTICPFDNKKCDYKMIIPADPTKGYNLRFCRYNHNMTANKDNTPCNNDMERKKQFTKPKSKLKSIKKCSCKNKKK
jgi:hypothetical protein